METALLKFIQAENADKAKKQKVPAYTTALTACNHLGIQRDQVMLLAKRLEQRGEIRIGRTISDYYFEQIQLHS